LEARLPIYLRSCVIIKELVSRHELLPRAFDFTTLSLSADIMLWKVFSALSDCNLLARWWIVACKNVHCYNLSRHIFTRWHTSSRSRRLSHQMNWLEHVVLLDVLVQTTSSFHIVRQHQSPSQSSVSPQPSYYPSKQFPKKFFTHTCRKSNPTQPPTIVTTTIEPTPNPQTFTSSRNERTVHYYLSKVLASITAHFPQTQGSTRALLAAGPFRWQACPGEPLHLELPAIPLDPE